MAIQAVPAVNTHATQTNKPKKFYNLDVSESSGKSYSGKIWWPVRALAAITALPIITLAGIVSSDPAPARLGKSMRQFVTSGSTPGPTSAVLSPPPPNSAVYPDYQPHLASSIGLELERRKTDHNYTVYKQEDERGDFHYSIDQKTGRILMKKTIWTTDPTTGRKIAEKEESFCIRIFEKGDDGEKPASSKVMQRAAKGLIEAMLSNPDFAQTLDDHDLVSLTIQDAKGDNPSLLIQLFTYQNRKIDPQGKPYWDATEAPLGYDAFGNLAKPTAFKGKEFKFEGKLGKRIIDAMNEEAPKIEPPKPQGHGQWPFPSQLAQPPSPVARPVATPSSCSSSASSTSPTYFGSPRNPNLPSNNSSASTRTSSGSTGSTTSSRGGSSGGGGGSSNSSNGASSSSSSGHRSSTTTSSSSTSTAPTTSSSSSSSSSSLNGAGSGGEDGSHEPVSVDAQD